MKAASLAFALRYGIISSPCKPRNPSLNAERLMKKERGSYEVSYNDLSGLGRMVCRGVPPYPRLHESGEDGGGGLAEYPGGHSTVPGSTPGERVASEKGRSSMRSQMGQKREAEGTGERGRGRTRSGGAQVRGLQGAGHFTQKGEGR
jgi:hypothetical protein